MSSAIDTVSLMDSLRALRMGYAKKQEYDPDRVVSAPWTRRDIGDMHYARDKLDWLLAEVKSGFSITEERHGWTIRNIMAIEAALRVKEFSYRAKFNPYHKPAGSPGGTGGEFDFAPGGGGARESSLGGHKPSLGRRISQETFGAKPSAADELPRNPDKRTEDVYDPSEKSPPIPVYKRQFVKQDDWSKFNKRVQGNNDLGDIEEYVYRQIFAAEGGMAQAPGGSAVAGIMNRTLKDIQDEAAMKGADPRVIALADKLKGVKTTDALTPEDIADIYKYDLDKRLKNIGGSVGLEDIGNPYVASAMADTVFRHGRSGGAKIILDAANEINKKNKIPSIDTRRKPGENYAVGNRLKAAYSKYSNDAVLKNQILDAIPKYRVAATEEEMANHLLDEARKNKTPMTAEEAKKAVKGKVPQGELDRFEYFRFEKERDADPKAAEKKKALVR